MSASYSTWFRLLDELLAETRQWWQVRAFETRAYPWASTYPQLVHELERLQDHELEAYASAAPQTFDRWRRWIPQLEALWQLSRLPTLARVPLSLPARVEVGVPGNKWLQNCAFVTSIPASGNSTLEWCAGKGHLGRLLAIAQQCPVSSLEWQSDLCRAGEALAQRDHAAQIFLPLDARGAAAAEQLGRHARAVALHACGDLHSRLLSAWVDSPSLELHLAPCCYQLVKSDHYRPLSASAQQAQVKLSRADLSTPLQATSTGGQGAHRRRLRELQLRLVFDEWQRDVRGIDEYLPLAAVRQSILAQPLPCFLRWACAQKGLNEPPARHHKHYLHAGSRRAARVRRIEVISHLFRRPLEVWLVLDRVLRLQEGGAEVTVGEFCSNKLTPRNILISASRV